MPTVGAAPPAWTWRSCTQLSIPSLEPSRTLMIQMKPHMQPLLQASLCIKEATALMSMQYPQGSNVTMGITSSHSPSQSRTVICLLSPWPMKSWFSQFPTACLHPPALTRALLHSRTLHAPQFAFLHFAAFLCCERSALLPVLGHPCVCPLAPSLANAP